MIPGEVIIKNASLTLNARSKGIAITATNKGDRPIQVGSHFHFFETNKFLSFDRARAYGYRLDIPSGSAIRFEPNETRTVNLVEIAGKKRVLGLNNLTDAQINESTKEASLQKAALKGFLPKGDK
jgi:urease subunit gamma/beta